MSDKKGFTRNFSILTICNIVVNVLGLFINVYLARKLTPAGYGEYGVILTIVSIFYTISSLGLQQIVIRSIARNQDNSTYYFHISVIARSLGLIFSVFLFLIYIFVFKNEYSVIIYILMIINIISFSLWDAFQNVAFGMQRMEYTGYINVFASTFMLITFLILPTRLLNIEIVILFIVIVQILKSLIYFYNLRRNHFFTGSKCKTENLKQNVNQLLKDSFPYYILAIFTLMTTQLPVLFLDKNAGVEQVAFFNTANKLLVPLTLLISTAMTALFPELSKLFINDKVLFQKKVESSFLFLILAGVFCAVIVTLFRNEVVLFLYGEEYRTAGMIMAYQCWYISLYAIFWFFGLVFGAADKQNLLSILSIVYAFISVPILWFCSKYGAEAVSKGYILISLINMTYHYYYFQQTLTKKISLLKSIKYFGIIIISFVFTMMIPDNLSLIIKMLISIVFSISFFLLVRSAYFRSVKSL